MRLLNILPLIRKMSSFKQVLNPLTGQCEWEMTREDYDYHQEVARAAFADMLHDTERNQKYYKALTMAIAKMQHRGLKAKVLDIGTGTGILSMMAVKSGADSVVACEAFAPMAECAQKVIELNGFSNKIRLIKKRSTDISVGAGLDMEERANILVTEVFDTELIGEGAISIFNHAHSHLLEDDCIVVPDAATIYAQIVECPLALAWNKPKLLASLDGDVLLRTPDQIHKCLGASDLHDVQLSQLSDFTAISKPIEIFQYSWSSKLAITESNSVKSRISSVNSGNAQVIFMWWDLKMDPAGEVLLSCAPYWAHPDYKAEQKVDWANAIPWRDHWMQAIYYLPKLKHVQRGDELTLVSSHDEFSFWFELEDGKTSEVQPFCGCGLHVAYSRTRIGQINESLRNKKYLSLMEKEFTKDSVVLCLSEGSLLALAGSAMGDVKQMYCFEQNRHSSAVMAEYIKFNELKNVKLFQNIDEIKDHLNEITIVFAEPHFQTSILPWDNFRFGTILNQLQLPEQVKIIPGKARIYAMPVEFLNLHKIRAPVGICEGFDLAIFDKFIEVSLIL